MWRLKTDPSSFRRLNALIQEGFNVSTTEPEQLGECDVVFTLLHQGRLAKVLELENICMQDNLSTEEKLEKVQSCLSKF